MFRSLSALGKVKNISPTIRTTNNNLRICFLFVNDLDSWAFIMISFKLEDIIDQDNILIVLILKLASGVIVVPKAITEQLRGIYERKSTSLTSVIIEVMKSNYRK